MQIRTARLILRRAVPSDAASLHPILCSPEAMRYWATPPHSSMAETEPWFREQFFNGDAGRDEWIIEHEARPVGFVGLWKMPELGFMLAPALWGRGLGSEAARAFVDYAFATHPIETITADVDPRNAASLNLLNKLGFVEAGRARCTILVGAEWCDSVYLSLSRPA